MSLAPALDVAIGLIFTYLLLGLLASMLQEFVAGVLKLRGRGLRNGLTHLLATTDAAGKPDDALFQKVFGHALVQGLADTKLPSYLPARNFALALIDALKDGTQVPMFSQIEGTVVKLPEGPAKHALTVFLTQAGGDLAALRTSLETWYDDAMDRVSGIYKRFTHYFTLVFGLVVAVAFNVDSINIANTLWLDPAARAATVASAQQFMENNPAPTAEQAQKQATGAREQLESLPLPIGWTDANRQFPNERTPWGLVAAYVTAKASAGVWVVLGWIITGLAVSLGAPFWFDTLQRFLNLRNAGVKPMRADASP